MKRSTGSQYGHTISNCGYMLPLKLSFRRTAADQTLRKLFRVQQGLLVIAWAIEVRRFEKDLWLIVNEGNNQLSRGHKSLLAKSRRGSV